MVGFQDETLRGALARLKSGAFRVLFLEALALHLPLGLFLGGGVVLLLRFAVGLERIDSAWGLALVALAPVTAMLVARGRMPDDGTLAAWLDRRSGGTGLVLAEYELADERWLAHAQGTYQRMGAHAPRPQAEGTTLWASVPAAIFVALAIWFTPPDPGPAVPMGLLQSGLDGLTRRLERAVDQGLLPQERVGELAERLEDIAGGLEDGGLEQTFEAMDRFREDLERDVAGFADELAALREALESLPPEAKDALAESLAGALSDSRTAELAQSAAQALAGMDAASLDPGALMALDSEALAGLQDAVSAALAQRMGDLAQAGFLSPEALAAALARRGTMREARELKPHEHDETCASRRGGL